MNEITWAERAERRRMRKGQDREIRKLSFDLRLRACRILGLPLNSIICARNTTWTRLVYVFVAEPMREAAFRWERRFRGPVPVVKVGRWPSRGRSGAGSKEEQVAALHMALEQEFGAAEGRARFLKLASCASWLFATAGVLGFIGEAEEVAPVILDGKAIQQYAHRLGEAGEVRQ